MFCVSLCVRESSEVLCGSHEVSGRRLHYEMSGPRCTRTHTHTLTKDSRWDLTLNVTARECDRWFTLIGNEYLIPGAAPNEIFRHNMFVLCEAVSHTRARAYHTHAHT